MKSSSVMRKAAAARIVAAFLLLGTVAACVSTPQDGRRLEWHRHAWDAAWGPAESGRTDSYALFTPRGGHRRHAPLLVALHARCAGVRFCGGAKWTVRHVMDGEPNVCQAPDDFYILCVDCMEHRETDFWWCDLPCLAGPRRADCARLVVASSTERRVMAEIEEVISRCGIDRDRVYIAGNSMGGQGALAYALAHPDVFAAACGNVSATVWFPLSRAGLVDARGDIRADASLPSEGTSWLPPDPPYCLEWSGSDDAWSRDHEYLYHAFAANRFPLVGIWGDYGHCLSIDKARSRNPLVGTFDWLSLRRCECYPVFTHASTDAELPWPASGAGRAALPCGQVNAYFRWRVLKDAGDEVSVELRLATAGELGVSAVPSFATTDVTLRRIQCRSKRPGAKAVWRYGGAGGEAVADGAGLFTFRELPVTAVPETLTLRFY